MPENATLGFGRSVPGGGELTDSEWHRFRAELRSLVGACGGNVHFSGEGIGRWEGESERAGCIAFFSDAETDWVEIRSGLRRLAHEYRQDAIALTVGESELVGLVNA